MGTAGGTQVLELRELIAQLTPRDGDHETSIDSLYLIRYSSSKTTDYAVLTPGFCIAAQGQKEVLLGEDAVYYQGTGHHIVSSTQLPVSGRILRATPDKPYLGLRVHFDLRSTGR